MRVFPTLQGHEAVIFHKDAAMPASWIILQIPLYGKVNKSNTFRLDMEHPEDQGWLRRLPSYDRLKYVLDLYGHAVYFPKTKEVRPIEDKAVQNLNITAQLIAGAEEEHQAEQRQSVIRRLLNRKARNIEVFK